MGGRTLLDHAHGVAGGRQLVDFDVLFAGAEVFLLHIGWNTAFLGDGEAGGDLDGGGAFFQIAHRVAAGENAARRNHGDIEVFRLQEIQHFARDGAQIKLGPIHAEAQVTTGQRAFHHDVIQLAIDFAGLAQKELQGAHGRHNQAELHVVETGVIFNQRHRAQM